MEIERRTFDFEVRADEGEAPKIVGYGAVFGRRSEDLGGFVEYIAPGAFDGVLNNDVRALWNHNPDFILGRTLSGTMRLAVDEIGLRYEIDPDTESGLVRDLVLRPMQRGDVSQSSFGFTVGEDSWEERDGAQVRTITRVDRLFDVSPVSYPAYPDATVALRRLEAVKDAPAPDKLAEQRPALDLGMGLVRLERPQRHRLTVAVLRAMIEALTDDERAEVVALVAGEQLEELRAESDRLGLLVRALRAGGGLRS